MNIYNEMADKIIKRLNENLDETKNIKNKFLVSDSAVEETQIFNDINKMLALKDEAIIMTDKYAKWFVKEFEKIESELQKHVNNEIYLRLRIMSAIHSYLAFLSKFPILKELEGKLTFEIFYNLFLKVGEEKGIKPYRQINAL